MILGLVTNSGLSTTPSGYEFLLLPLGVVVVCFGIVPGYMYARIDYLEDPPNGDRRLSVQQPCSNPSSTEPNTAGMCKPSIGRNRRT